jgi:hypothetical protein
MVAMGSASGRAKVVGELEAELVLDAVELAVRQAGREGMAGKPRQPKCRHRHGRMKRTHPLRRSRPRD